DVFRIPYNLDAHLYTAAYTLKLRLQGIALRIKITLKLSFGDNCAEAKRQRRRLRKHTAHNPFMRQHVLARDIYLLIIKLAHNSSDLSASNQTRLCARHSYFRLNRVVCHFIAQTVSIKVHKSTEY